MNLFYKARRRVSLLHQRKTSTDFCQLFMKEMKDLYLLSLLLTAKPELAEECLMSSLDDCLNGVAVAAGWEYSWAKRAVIKNAIRLIGPVPHSATTAVEECRARGYDNEHPTIRNVLALRDFERIVFVMSVLEQYSDRDSAALLGRAPQEIKNARMQAFRGIAII